MPMDSDPRMGRATVPTTILVAEDHEDLRCIIRAILERQPELEVVGEAGNGQTAVQLALELLPDIVLMDVSMPVLDGVEATRRMLAQAPEVKVIAVSVYREKRVVQSMLDAGASGYVLKDRAYKEVANAVRTVHSGRRYLSPGLAESMGPH